MEGKETGWLSVRRSSYLFIGDHAGRMLPSLGNLLSWPLSPMEGGSEVEGPGVYIS